MRWTVFVAFVVTLTVSARSVAAHPESSPPRPTAVRAPASSFVPIGLPPDLRQALEGAGSDEQISVFVTLTAQIRPSELSALTAEAPGRRERLRAVNTALRRRAATSQRGLLSYLQAAVAMGRASDVRAFWIVNGVALKGTPDLILALAQRPDVERITLDVADIVPIGELSSFANTAIAPPNAVVINVPAVWELGYRGQGIVVATMDTGVDETHPDLLNRWRGGTNSWFDPYGEHPTDPTDLARDSSGHGTWVTGVMVAGDASGTTLGMAPDAQWIAVKIFPDRTSPTVSAIHAGFEWLLDPDDNALTDDAPHVVVNAWSMLGTECNLEFERDMQALRAAGIVPVFAGGNSGPNPATSLSPGNNPSAFAVGATDNDDAIYLNSSRGPSACGEAPTIYPEIVAPGVGITTTDRYGLYFNTTGTSLAAPHVGGALALLLSANPDLSAEEQMTALLTTARDLGEPGPDNVFGYGRLDVLAAFQQIPPRRYVRYLPIVRWMTFRERAYLPLVLHLGCPMETQ